VAFQRPDLKRKRPKRIEAVAAVLIVLLGHADMRTIEIYLHVDPSEKLAAMEGVLPPSLRRGRFRTLYALITSLQLFKDDHRPPLAPT
jgi:hypothetical protein